MTAAGFHETDESNMTNLKDDTISDRTSTQTQFLSLRKPQQCTLLKKTAANWHPIKTNLVKCHPPMTSDHPCLQLEAVTFSWP